jgi:molybdate transport system substrate-binding protein
MKRRWAMRTNPLLVVALVTIVTGAAACGASAGTGGRSEAERGLTVAAAASLTAAFTQIGRSFEERNVGVTVSFSFGPSDGLATLINEGAPVDVFASASPRWMDVVEADGPGVTGRAEFARNELAIIVPEDNPENIRAIDDLTRTGVQLVLAAEGVPAGDYARQIITNAGIGEAAMRNVVSNEEDVKSVVTKVLTGEADAGIAYATDVTPNLEGRVTLIAIPDDVNVIATYPIAVVSGSREADLAQGFVDYVLGDGQRILAEHGFSPAR